MAIADRDAHLLLQKLWAEPPAGVNLPVDPFSIAKKLGIRVYLDATLPAEVSGMLVKASGYEDPQILLNASDHRNRQRFTCAHELGHYNKRVKQGDNGAWNYVDRRDLLSTQGHDPDEIYANQFAAALLMPGELVKQKWPGNEQSALAYEFGVSADAMNNRLKNLGLKK